jgi:SlyX protein
MSGGMVDQSIEEIESKITYLEHAIGELSDVVFAQQREIRALKTEIDQLRDRLEAAREEERPAGPDLERPPHY